MKSSYTENKYGNVFKALSLVIKPKKVVEFGILDGYSLESFALSTDKNCKIEAFDLFDDFPYNAADYQTIKNKFSSFENVVIKKSDFYKSMDLFEDESIDIMHIDIANNGDVFKFAVENYLKKISKNGVMILEGGSKERDEYEWMIKYEKPKISPYLENIKEFYKFVVLEDFPSITIFKK